MSLSYSLRYNLRTSLFTCGLQCGLSTNLSFRLPERRYHKCISHYTSAYPTTIPFLFINPFNSYSTGTVIVLSFPRRCPLAGSTELSTERGVVFSSVRLTPCISDLPKLLAIPLYFQNLSRTAALSLGSHVIHWSDDKIPISIISDCNNARHSDIQSRGLTHCYTIFQ